MPQTLATEELAKILKVLAHPYRIRIVEELRQEALDVNALEEALGISHARVSQHLAVMRSHQLVRERREGRRVFYSLLQPELAAWLLRGLQFLEHEAEDVEQIRQSLQEAKALWSEE